VNGKPKATYGNHRASLQPEKHPRLTLTPALAIAGDAGADAKVMAFGGADVITQGVLQALLNFVELGMTLQQALEAPRIASLAFPDSFYPHVHEWPIEHRGPGSDYSSAGACPRRS
jgi:gamma-glutamyltranspeptidase/glutathione hydrolase